MEKMNEQRIRRIFLGIAHITLLMLYCVSVQAAPRVVVGNVTNASLATSGNPAFLLQYQSLVNRARAQGSIRVIFGVRAPFAPEAVLSDQEQRQQRVDIRTAQDDVLQQLPTLSKVNGSLKRFETIPFMAAEVTPSELEHLVHLQTVTLLQEDRPMRAQLNESLPLLGISNGSFNGYRGTGQTVAILDTGVDKTHNDLNGRVVSEACYSSTESTYGSQSLCPGGVASSTASGSALPYASGVCPNGACDHGTHAASIAAGTNGVARGAKIIAVQVFSKFPAGANCGASPCVMSFESDQIAGLERVYTLRNLYSIAAVNLSLGGDRYTSQATCDVDFAPIKAAIDTLKAVDIATVISSGNDGYTDSLSAPACVSSAVSVGATWDSSGGANSCESGSLVDRVACYSNSASFLSLLAPGSLITASIPGGSHAAWNGTSMAAPHVSGAWAVIKSRASMGTVDQVLNALTMSGNTVVDARNGISKPRINVAAALETVVISNQSLSLTISGTGVGTVSSTPSGVSCKTSCISHFAPDTVVTLTASADSSSTFAGWGGECSGSGMTCTVTMSSARSVSASFALRPSVMVLNLTDQAGAYKSLQHYQINVPASATDLVISISGGTGDADLYVKYGSQPSLGSYDCGPAGSASYGNNDVCTFSAPSLGTYYIMLYGFWNYSGVTLKATYRIDPTLNVSLAGTGSGSVSSSPAGIDCGSVCERMYPAGTIITLTASPSSGNYFDGWSGELCTGNSTTCTFSLNSDQFVTATFSPQSVHRTSALIPILMLLLDD